MTPQSILKAIDVLWETNEQEVQQYAFNVLRSHYEVATGIKASAKPGAAAPEAKPKQHNWFDNTKQVIEAGLNPHDTKEYVDQIKRLFAVGNPMLTYEQIVRKLCQMTQDADGWQLTDGDYADVVHGDGLRKVYRRRASDALCRLVKDKWLYMPKGGMYEKN
jgi:hypothetical protein